MALYLIWKCRFDTLSEIGTVYGIEHYSTVSNNIMITKRLAEESELRKDIEMIMKYIKKSQKKT